MDGAWITFFLVFGFIILTAVFTWIFPVLHWFMASQADLRISLLKLIQLRFKGYPLDILIDNMIKIKDYKLPFSLEELLVHYDNGGNIDNLIKGMVIARHHNISLSKNAAIKADLNKIDIESGIKEIASKP